MDAQVSAAIRNLLIFFGGVIATKFGIDGSYVPTIVGVVMSVIGGVWSALGHTTQAKIAAVAAMPEVKAVLTIPEIAHGPRFKEDSKVVTPSDIGVPSTVVIN